MPRCRLFGLAGALLAAVLAFGYASSAAPLLAPRLADLAEKTPRGSVEVDVELVLAVDISFSMDMEELALQRDGYLQAITSPEFVNAVREGINGRIAVTYFEWAGFGIQHRITPWRMIDGHTSAAAFAAEIAQAPTRRGRRTSISGALRFGTAMFDDTPYRGLRKVIDVSGDGTNNDGPLVTVTRDETLAKGVTINGLPVMLRRPNPSTLDIENLDVYYEDCVIGGPGAFVVPVREKHEFVPAIRKKLLLEIAGRMPEARIMPAQARAPRISCTIGERMWQERWGREDWR
jgi:hypothetical protein